MNPTLRGFLVIALIVVVVYVLQLERTLQSLYLIMSIVFVLAMAFFVYMLWRERREAISTCSSMPRSPPIASMP